MSKQQEIEKLHNQLSKKETEKQKALDLIEKQKEKIASLDSDITLLRAKIITATLEEKNLSFQDLKQLLS